MKSERRRITELNMLSTYLDNALTKSERQKLEARLAQEPELQKKLENLRKTKILVGSLPRLHAPRNLTLTSEMVTVRKKKQPLFSALRLVSSLAAILLVVLFGVELLSGSPAMMPEPVMEAATFAEGASPEPLIFWGVPDAGGADTDGLGSDSSFAEEPMMEMEVSPVESEGETETAPTQPEEAQPKDIAETDETTEQTRAMPGEEGNLPILGLNPKEGGQIIQRSEPASSSDDGGLPGIDAIRWVQIALAVIAVGSGLTLWILRNRRLS